MHACMHACMHAYIHTYIHLNTHNCMDAFLSTAIIGGNQFPQKVNQKDSYMMNFSGSFGKLPVAEILDSLRYAHPLTWPARSNKKNDHGNWERLSPPKKPKVFEPLEKVDFSSSFLNLELGKS